MLRFFDLVPPAAEEFGDPPATLRDFVFWMVVGVGIMYAIGKWREGK